MNDPNVKPVQLIDFDLETLSEMSYLAAGRIAFLQELLEGKWSSVNQIEIHAKIHRAMIFRTQLLHAFSRVKSEQSVTNS